METVGGASCETAGRAARRSSLETWFRAWFPRRGGGAGPGGGPAGGRQPEGPSATQAAATRICGRAVASCTRGATAVPVAGGRLGSYRLLERIGRGRQADVWRARREEAPTIEVALKLLVSTAATRDPRRFAQLRHEAERGRRLAGPSLLPAFDFGEADGIAFLAMPLVRGCPLGEIIQQRRALRSGEPNAGGIHPLATAGNAAYRREVVALVAKVARAVAAAHDAQVVHRDIKPMNILVGRREGRDDDAGPGVYLCDFGLARDLDVATPSQLRDGAGSPLYMAPERLLKRPADEVRCDVYALGVTLFEALALAPPFEVPPELPPAAWPGFLARAAPPRLGDFAPGASPMLQAVVHRALDRSPSRRQATALRLAYDLERVLAYEPGAGGKPRPAGS